MTQNLTKERLEAALGWLNVFKHHIGHMLEGTGEPTPNPCPVETITAALDTLLAAQPVELPDGWKMVPIEPTEQMIHVGIDELQNTINVPQLIYKAMLAASPEYTGISRQLPEDKAAALDDIIDYLKHPNKYPSKFCRVVVLTQAVELRQLLQTPAPINSGGWDAVKGEYKDSHLLAPLVIFTTDSLGNRKRYQHDDYMIVRVPNNSGAQNLQSDALAVFDDAMQSIRWLLNHASETPRKYIGGLMSCFTIADNYTTRVDEQLENLWEKRETIRAALQPRDDSALVKALSIKPEFIKGAIQLLKSEHLRQPNPNYPEGGMVHSYYLAMLRCMEALAAHEANEVTG